LIIHEDDENTLAHYGILRRSGRYPYGSGKDGANKYPWEDGDTEYERATAFQKTTKELRSKGLSDKEIAAGYGMSTSDFRATVALAKTVRKQQDIATAQKLKEKGLSNVAIAKRMGIPDTTVGNLLAPGAKAKADILSATAQTLRDEIAKKKYIDVGKGVELHMKISHEKLRDARKLLESEGYKVHYVPIEQLGTGKSTTLKVLSAPGVSYGEVYKNRDHITPALVKSDDGGLTFDGVEPPLGISSKRIKVRYAEEGGTDADGVIYVRRGVKDVSLGKANYAQVRIMVDGTHYLKGMAVYRDDLPDGVDLVFNTNKSDTGNKLDAMKKIDRDKNPDPRDPFGATISNQVYRKNADGSYARDSKGNRIPESVMNIVNEEGTWGTWSKSLSSQMLSKQPKALVKKQLDLAYDSKKKEFEELQALTNPTVKKHLMEKFADSADGAAVHLKAAAMPRQGSYVILPVNTMKDTEIYAPRFKDGERVVLVRYPHGGIFEIPELKVNNRHPDAKKMLGNAPDAVGIHHKVAERLSGADFDGDTVLVIPNNKGEIKNRAPLKQLEGFDPKSAYPAYEGMPRMTAKQKGREMGDVSNLITDMTIMGAPFDEIARAVKHSMVVIDAEKHHLDYKRSAQENGISALKEKYQGGKTKGASTIVSRSGSDARVNERKLRPQSQGGPIDKKTGKLVYVETGAEYSPGNPKKEKVKKLAVVDDAHELSSGTPKEELYADHSNRLKDLANKARLEQVHSQDIAHNPSATKAYAKEVAELDAALNRALRNAPLERQAQVVGNAIFRQKREANPDWDTAEIKKAKAKALLEARTRVGARKKQIEITESQWKAIQAGAISKTKLERILDNADIEKVKELATPRAKQSLSTADLARASAMLGRGNTLAEVAEFLGVSTTTLTEGLADG
jgi:predicted transcriptional regulator